MRIKACTFDVFGTCVDWRGSVEAMFADKLSRASLPDGEERPPDVPQMTQTWRDGYSRYNARMASGEISIDAFETIDVVHRRLLDELVREHGLVGVWTTAELDEMNLVWHRLAPWEDTSRGIAALKRHLIVSTLSNGNMRLLVDQAKFGDLAWDILISSELFKSAKPNPKVYLGACKMLNLEPEEVGSWSTREELSVRDSRTLTIPGRSAWWPVT